MSLEMNKVAAAVLTGGIVAMLSGFVAGKLYHPETLEEPVYKVALPEGAGGKEEAPKEESILPLLASADVEAGKKESAKCSACHSFDEGGATKVGPNLWGIVGSEPAHVAGFNFSDALQKLNSEGKKWDYVNLSDFLKDPKGYAPGTIMQFNGVRKIKARANLIAYLRTLSNDPVPLPTKEEIEAVEGKDETKKTEAEGASGEETQTAAAAPAKSDETAEAPKAEEPKAEESTAAKAEEPKAEESTEAKAEEPKAEETVAATSTEAPKAEEAKTEEPKAEEASTAAAPKAEEETKTASAAEAPKAGDTQTAAAATAAGGAASELGKLLANADVDKGKKVARKCTACHTFEEGGKNKVGPNLYNIIGKTAGEGDGYKFSKALAAKGAEGYTWTYQHLDDYLANPKKAIPGNKMTFPGLKKPQDRADVIAYIRSLASDAPPLPN